MSVPVITRDLRILTVHDLEPDGLAVDIYGGPSNACGTVKFEGLNPDQRAIQKGMIDQWITDDTPVVLVDTDGHIELIPVAIFDQNPQGLH